MSGRGDIRRPCFAAAPCKATAVLYLNTGLLGGDPKGMRLWLFDMGWLWRNAVSGSE
jgi:hypothetical protein